MPALLTLSLPLSTDFGNAKPSTRAPMHPSQTGIRESAQYRAQGSQLAQTITANADREVVVTLGNARRDADQTRGAGDADRNCIPEPISSYH